MKNPKASPKKELLKKLYDAALAAEEFNKLPWDQKAHGDPRAGGTYIDGADVAKLIRYDLAEKFPGIKFKVHLSRYAGGESIYVSYTDGVPWNVVRPVVGFYSGAGFDGMIDLEYSNYHYLTPDMIYYAGTEGTVGSGGVVDKFDSGLNYDLPKEGYGHPVKVHLIAKYNSVDRDISDEGWDRIVAEVQKFYGIDTDWGDMTFEQHEHGHALRSSIDFTKEVK